MKRRAFFRQLAGITGPISGPPWTGEDLTERCTRCEECIHACPEQVLVIGSGGFPEIDFSKTGCTFCGDCVKACDADVFDLRRPAFPWHVQIGERCLAHAGIACQSCQDACEARAIRFQPRLGGVPQPQLSEEACTGCGACLPVCPSQTIEITVNDISLAQPEPAYD